MFAFLRRLFGGMPRECPHPSSPTETGQRTPLDPELQDFLDRRTREALGAIHKERAAEQLLAPRERIKKRLNLPDELPADYKADDTVPVLSPAGAGLAGTVVVVNRAGVGLRMPQVLFEYLYRQRAPTAEDEGVINGALGQLGLGPERLCDQSP